MSFRQNTTILLIGVATMFRKDLVTHLGNSFNFVEVQTKFSSKALGLIPNINLIFFDLDQMNIEYLPFHKEIKALERYNKIPIIGLAMKKHVDEINPELKANLDDLILLPTGMEDVLTRVDLWVKTYKNMRF
jgi:hypothetical protein